MDSQTDGRDANDVQTFTDSATHAVGASAPLYAKRTKIFPKRAEGRFRRLKWIVMAATLGVYYLTPWLRWDRGPYAPDQAVLLDLANRRFYFFFIEIWPQEFFYVAGLLVMAGIGLFLVTSVVGRAWCGYACPQTVWTDLFLTVERAVEGDRNARMRLDKAPYDAAKIAKRVLKHAIWIVISVATGGAWIFYFADAPTLMRDVVTLNAPFVAYATIGILTFTTYCLGGLMREQVCIYMCPWPRIQAAMLDEHSLTVTYNDWRGEPRSRHRKRAAAAGEPVGDCIDCNACVAVCPTGIDIREGQQLGCITCALCIDACDAVMDKIGKERGLIAYATFNDYETNMALASDPVTGQIVPSRVRDASGRFAKAFRHFDWRIMIRARTLIYLAAWCAIGLALVTALSLRSRLDLNVQHDRNPVFVTLKDGSTRNGYTVKLLNMVPEPRTLTLAIAGLDGALMSIPDLGLDGVSEADVPVEPDLLRSIKVFISQAPDAAEPGSSEFRFTAVDRASGEADRYDAIFETPDRP
ncbi:cytochrome c oxidase accessory protein CcoG [Fulvimarina sp. 2208YS6-2-32]|uniref:Cytochrome c oxidase accessory protein CcoG n=1 Tax=Fulvimarina uroteuthidis TaxID=3098149 RepID=A0ABU5I416_9HYPH|nr:cytochrome c oxidase accessory protein CcoG [Fulvimarina sp. 2208YS6-2-32]MDY8109825.1 cytochrome c oxidase accessory protein CcoG [Fulvimarina sp. 2208YS6-2-32]